MKTVIKVVAATMMGFLFLILLGMMIPSGGILVSTRVFTPLEGAQNGIHVALVKTVQANVPGMEVRVAVDDMPGGYYWLGAFLRVADRPISSRRLKETRMDQLYLSSVLREGSNGRSDVFFLSDSELAKAYLVLSFRRKHAWIQPAPQMRYLIPIQDHSL